MQDDQPPITIPQRSLAKPTAIGIGLLLICAIPIGVLIHRVMVGTALNPTICDSPDGQYRCRVTPRSGVYIKSSTVEVYSKSLSGGWNQIVSDKFIHEETLPRRYSFLWLPDHDKGLWRLTVYERVGTTNLIEIDSWAFTLGGAKAEREAIEEEHLPQMNTDKHR